MACIATSIMVMDSFGPSPDTNSTMDIGVESILELVAPVWLAYQALTLKGVPQVEPEEDEVE